LDGKTTNGCLSPVTYTGLSSAGHTFSLRSKLTPPAKSKAATVTYGWVVDTTPPQAPTVHSVAGPTKNTSQPVFYDDVADPSAVSFTCALNDPNPSAASSVCDNTNHEFDVSGLSEGIQTVYVYAFDVLGNR